MLCQESDCSNPADFICKLCSTFKIFCPSHGVAHSKRLNHKIESLSEEESSILMLKSIKRKIKDSIAQISNETEIITSEINKASKFAIRNLKEMNKNITTISDLKLMIFGQSFLQNIREQATNLKNGMNKIGARYAAFTSFSLDERKRYARLNWKMINVDDFELLHLSENGKYLFGCTFYLGIRQADKNYQK